MQEGPSEDGPSGWIRLARLKSSARTCRGKSSGPACGPRRTLLERARMDPISRYGQDVASRPSRVASADPRSLTCGPLEIPRSYKARATLPRPERGVAWADACSPMSPSLTARCDVTTPQQFGCATHPRTRRRVPPPRRRRSGVAHRGPPSGVRPTVYPLHESGQRSSGSRSGGGRRATERRRVPRSGDARNPSPPPDGAGR